MKRNWFNWFGKEAAHQRGARPRRRLGAGFEAIEPRLLMSRDTVKIEISPSDLDAVLGDTVLIDIDIAPAAGDRGGSVVNDPTRGDGSHDTESEDREAIGGFVDIGSDNPDDTKGDFGTSEVDNGPRAGAGSAESTIGDTGPVGGQLDVLLAPSDGQKPDGLDPAGFDPIATDPMGRSPLDTDPISLPPGDLYPYFPDPSIPDPIGTSSDGDPSGPGTMFEPGPGLPSGEEEFGLPSHQPDRLATPLPDGHDDKGGAIDITPRGPLGREDESVTPLPQQQARTAPPQSVESNTAATGQGTEAELALRASRGESQAFELVMSNWRRDQVVAQRVAPPKPHEILPAKQAIAAAMPNAGEVEPQHTEPTTEPSAERREVQELASVEAAPIVTQLGLLPAVQQALIAALGLLSDEGEPEKGAAKGADHSPGRRSAPSSLEILTAPLDDRSHQHLPATDHDTAARMVGVGLIVIAGQASALYFHPDRPLAQRTPTRDWELDLERNRS